MDASTRQKLDDFRRALSDAINESSAATRKLDELREAGYSLYLLLDGTRDTDGDETVPRDRALQRTGSALPVRAERGWLLAPEHGSDRGPDRNHGPSPPRPEPEPRFLLTPQDVSILRSLGIDPTRKTRRRKHDPR